MERQLAAVDLHGSELDGFQDTPTSLCLRLIYYLTLINVCNIQYQYCITQFGDLVSDSFSSSFPFACVSHGVKGVSYARSYEEQSR